MGTTMEGMDYRKLITEEALRTKSDPEEAFADFQSVVCERATNIEEGTRLQQELRELGAQYDHHLKGAPLPEGVEPLPMKVLKSRYGFARNAQHKANANVVILTRRANKLLGSNLITTPNRSAKGGGDDA